MAIHGGLRDDDNADEGLFIERAQWFWKRGHRYPGKLSQVEQGRGAIIGVVDLVGVHRCESHSPGSDVPDCTRSGTPLAMTCSSWAEFRRGETTHHLVLANPRPLDEPIPFKGALGLRELDAETTARILEAVAT